MLKRFSTLLLVVIMLLSTTTAFASVVSELDYGDVTFPLTDEPITFTAMVSKQAVTEGSWYDMEYLNELQEMTNVYFEWIEVAEDAWVEKVQIMLASGEDLPDLFISGYDGIDASLLYTYCKQGLILCLDEYYEDEELMPNAYSILESRPDFDAAITFPDGHKYTIPSVEETDRLRYTDSYQCINVEWLEALGLDMPTTFEELNEVLYAFKEYASDDAVILTGSWEDCGYNMLFGLFGIVDDSSHIMIEDDVVTFTATTDEYRQCVEWLHQLYVDGILDPEIFTQSSTQMLVKTQSEAGAGYVLYRGLFCSSDVYNPTYEDLLPLEEGATGEAQHTCTSSIIPNMNLTGCFISADCENVEVLMAFMDIFLGSNKTTLTFRFAAEDDYWSMVDEDSWVINDTNVNGENVSDAYATQFSWGPRGVFWIMKDFAQVMAEGSLGAILNSNIEERIAVMIQTWPTQLLFEEDDNEIYLSITSDLYDYVDNMVTQFVFNGVTDESWESYVATCEAYGCETLVELMQERWNEII